MKYLHIITCLTFIIAAFGCGSSPNQSYGGYGTDPTVSRGDSLKAAAFNEVAVELMAENKLEEAEAKFKEALTADVRFGPAHNNLGTVYFEQRRFYLAAWEFEYAIKLMPAQPEPRNTLGLVFETVDRLDKAVAYYTKAIELQPDNPEIIGNLVRARINRGDRDAELRELLADFILKDTRLQWRTWAKKKLALFPNLSQETTDQ